MKGSAALAGRGGGEEPAMFNLTNLITSVLASPSVDYQKIELRQTDREREETLGE